MFQNKPTTTTTKKTQKVRESLNEIQQKTEQTHMRTMFTLLLLSSSRWIKPFEAKKCLIFVSLSRSLFLYFSLIFNLLSQYNCEWVWYQTSVTNKRTNKHKKMGSNKLLTEKNVTSSVWMYKKCTVLLSYANVNDKFHWINDNLCT